MRPGLIPDVNVDRVDVEAGLRKAAELGYDDPVARMVAEYALMRHRRGEEEGAERSWLAQFPRDLTSWKVILASAVAEADRAAPAAQHHTGIEEPSPTAEEGVPWGT